METLFTIQEQLPEGVEVSDFQTDDQLKLTSVTLQIEDQLTLENTNQVVEVLNDNLSGFSLNGSMERGQLRATIR